MEYKFKSHPTRYKNTLFRSRLEARYAAFFDLLGFVWEYEPFDLDGWTPDFVVHMPCTAIKGCREKTHDILVEVKPYTNPNQFTGHPVVENSGLGFGYSPRVYTNGAVLDNMVHHSIMHIDLWLQRPANGIDGLWAEAGNITRYQPPKETR